MSRVPHKFLLSFWVKAGHNQPVHGTGWRGEEQEFILKNAVVRIWLKGNTFIAHRAHATHAQFFQGGLIALIILSSGPPSFHVLMHIRPLEALNQCCSSLWASQVSTSPAFSHTLFLYQEKECLTKQSVFLIIHPSKSAVTWWLEEWGCACSGSCALFDKCMHCCRTMITNAFRHSDCDKYDWAAPLTNPF